MTAPFYLVLDVPPIRGVDPTELDRCRTYNDALRSAQCGYIVNGERVAAVIYKKVREVPVE